MKCEKEYIKKDKRCFERCSCTVHAVLVPFPLQREKERILHFIYKAFRALRLLKELEEKCYRERNVTVQTKGGLKMAYSLAYKCSPIESSQVGTSPGSSPSVNSLCCHLCRRMGLCRQTM